MAIKKRVLVRLRPLQERLGPFPFIPARKKGTKVPQNDFGDLNFRPSELRRAYCFKASTGPWVTLQAAACESSFAVFC